MLIKKDVQFAVMLHRFIRLIFKFLRDTSHASFKNNATNLDLLFDICKFLSPFFKKVRCGEYECETEE